MGNSNARPRGHWRGRSDRSSYHTSGGHLLPSDDPNYRNGYTDSLEPAYRAEIERWNRQYGSSETAEQTMSRTGSTAEQIVLGRLASRL